MNALKSRGRGSFLIFSGIGQKTKGDWLLVVSSFDLLKFYWVHIGVKGIAGYFLVNSSELDGVHQVHGLFVDLSTTHYKNLIPIFRTMISAGINGFLNGTRYDGVFTLVILVSRDHQEPVPVRSSLSAPSSNILCISDW